MWLGAAYADVVRTDVGAAGVVVPDVVASDVATIDVVAVDGPARYAAKPVRPLSRQEPSQDAARVGGGAGAKPITAPRKRSVIAALAAAPAARALQRELGVDVAAVRGEGRP